MNLLKRIAHKMDLWLQRSQQREASELEPYVGSVTRP
jgi:hypothetical protein